MKKKISGLRIVKKKGAFAVTFNDAFSSETKSLIKKYLIDINIESKDDLIVSRSSNAFGLVCVKKLNDVLFTEFYLSEIKHYIL